MSIGVAPAKPQRNYWGRVTWRGAKPGCANPKNGLAVPLGVAVDDFSPEACAARVALHMACAQLNPAGWRQPRLTTRANSLAPSGRRHLRDGGQMFSRVDTMLMLARLAGKASLLTRIKAAVRA